MKRNVFKTVTVLLLVVVLAAACKKQDIKLIPETTVQDFLTHVKGKSFVVADVAAALNLAEETAVSILIYLIDH